MGALRRTMDGTRLRALHGGGAARGAHSITMRAGTIGGRSGPTPRPLERLPRTFRRGGVGHAPGDAQAYE